MNKSTLVGGGAGLLILVLLAGLWFNARAPESQQPVEPNGALGANAVSGATQPDIAGRTGPETDAIPLASDRPGNGAGANAPAPPSDPSKPVPWSAGPAEPASTAEKKPLSKAERRAIRAEVRNKMTELLAKGPNATAKDTQIFLDEVEKLGQGMFDPRYFSTMREIVGDSARTQSLSTELGRIANSKAPKDVARQQEILAEMRSIGDRLSSGAASLQSYARDTVSEKAAQ